MLSSCNSQVFHPQISLSFNQLIYSISMHKFLMHEDIFTFVSMDIETSYFKQMISIQFTLFSFNLIIY